MINQSNIADQLLHELVREASDILSDGHVTFGEIVRLGGSLAGKANQFAQISGRQKQVLVIQAIDIALKEVLSLKVLTLPEDQRDAFRVKIESAASFAKDILPVVLDVAVQAARGQLDLRKPEVRKTIWQTLKALLGCCAVQAPVLPTPVAVFLGDQKEPSELALNLELIQIVPNLPQTEQHIHSDEAHPANTASS